MKQEHVFDGLKKDNSICEKLVLNYYRDFQCLMGDCRDNCCDDPWTINFDKKDYLKLRRLDADPKLKKTLEETVSRIKDGSQLHSEKYYAMFKPGKTGHCPLRNEQGLCSIQVSCGAEALPEVCRIYPRIYLWTPSWKIYYLTMSCEAVLQQFWELREGIDFVEEPLKESEIQFWKYNKNNLILLRHGEIMSALVDILQDRRLSIPERLLYLGMSLQKLCALDWAKPEVDVWLTTVYGSMEDPTLAEVLAQVPGDLNKFLIQNCNMLIDACYGKEEFTELCQHLSADLTKENQKFIVEADFQKFGQQFQNAREKFQKTFGDINYFWENILVNLLFQLQLAALIDPKSLWDNYVKLCNFYSVLRFSAIFWCDLHPSKEALFHIIVLLSREILHNSSRQNQASKAFHDNKSDSLAHMAILIRE